MKTPDQAGRPGYATNLKINLAKRVAALTAHDSEWRTPSPNPNPETYRTALTEAEESLEDLTFLASEAQEELLAARQTMADAESAFARGAGSAADFEAAMQAHGQAEARLEAIKAGEPALTRARDVAALQLEWAELVAGAAKRLRTELRAIEMRLGAARPADHPETLRRAARAPLLASVVAMRRNITRYLPESERVAWDAETDALES